MIPSRSQRCRSSRLAAFAPDLAAEIALPNDTSSEVEAKAELWVQAGCKMLLVVDQTDRTIRIYKKAATSACYGKANRSTRMKLCEAGYSTLLTFLPNQSVLKRSRLLVRFGFCYPQILVPDQHRFCAAQDVHVTVLIDVR